MLAPETSTARGPDWFAEALRQGLHELAEFFRTGIAFTLRPSRFADEWYRGERQAMNPLGCLATAAAILLPVQVLCGRWLPGEHADTLLAQAFDAAGPYLHYAALGAIAHPLMRLAGSRRSLQGSVGVALYAGALPGLGGSMLVALTVALFYTSSQHAQHIEQPLIVAIVLGMFGLFLGVACAGLAGLHRVHWSRALLALLVAFVVMGVFFGYAKPPGEYGLHLTLKLGQKFPSMDLGIVF
jgi:hypothetical protein